MIIKKKITILIFLVLISLIDIRDVNAVTTIPSPEAKAAYAVWAEDDMTWILKNDPIKANSAITLYSAKREYESFQIVVQAPASSALTGVMVTVSDLVGNQNAVIPASNITLYREYYVHVSRGSEPSDGSNKPLGSGWYPDGLIPFTNPDTLEDLSGTLDASPFNVPAGENQPIFIDIYTPPETPPGLYTGTVTISANQTTRTIQIFFNVWNFTLPLSKSLRAITELDYSGSRRTLSNDKVLLSHGFNPTNVNRSDERYLMDNYGLNMVNAFGWSNSSYSHCTPISPAPSVSSVQQAAADHEQGLYLYSWYADEIWSCSAQFPIYLQWARNLRSGGIHPLMVTYPVPELMGTSPDYADSAGDIWVVLPADYDKSKSYINTLAAQGVEMWSYNPLLQDTFSPKLTIDYLPINSRIMHGFINQSLGLKGTLVWRVDFWTSNPWTAKERYNAENGTQAPGEGDITYSGNEVGLPNQIIPGMRMKWFRDGSEDYEYIQMLKNLGRIDFVMSVVRSVVVDFHLWTKNKDELLAARIKLGEELDSLYSPGGTCSRKAQGDADCDGVITLSDFEIWRKENFQTSSTKQADFDGSSKIDLADFEQWRKGYFSI